MHQIVQTLTSPIGALALSLILAGIGLSGRLSVNASRILLGIGWIICVAPLVQTSFGWLWLTLYTVALGAIAIWARPETVPRDFGEIIPGRRLLWSQGKNSKSPPRIEIGNSGTIFQWDGPAGEAMFKFFGRSHLMVEIIRGRVMVSTSVTDHRGNIIAEIIRNQWKATPPHAWDRNYSRDAFEVKDARGKIVLQVRALSDRIQLQAEWWGDEINGIRLQEAPEGGGAHFVVFAERFRPEHARDIGPMFKYPSARNLGKRADA